MRAAHEGSVAALYPTHGAPAADPPPVLSPAVRGAVEFGLMSTTTDRATASAYSGVDKKRGTVLEIAAGQVRTDPSQASRSPRTVICSPSR